MNRQILTAIIDVKADTGATNSSFQGYPTNVDLFSGQLTWEPRYFADVKTDKALSGRLRSRLQGYRLTGTLQWERTLQTDEICDLLGTLPFGRERLFWQSTTNTVNVATTTLNVADAPAGADYFNGMTIDFNGADTRNIVDYTAPVITINSAVGLSGGETLNIYTRANMQTRVFFGPDATDPTNTDAVILDGDVPSVIESTIVRQPITLTLEGVDIEPEIPAYYRL
jgi:hypothetical protein